MELNSTPNKTGPSTTQEMDDISQYYLKTLGYFYKSRAKCMLLMDNSPQRNIVYMFKLKIDKQRRALYYSAVDTSGTEQFLTVKNFHEGNDEGFTVLAGSQKIGMYKMNASDHEGGPILIQTFGESGCTTIQGSVEKVNKCICCEFKTALGIEVCSMNNQYEGILSVTFVGALDEKTKTVLFSVGVFVMFLKIVGTYGLSITSISIQQQDLENKVGKPRALKTAAKWNKLFHTGDIIIGIVGRNTQKNIVYYEVYDQSSATIHATIEVTPVKNYQRYAQMIIKDSTGTTLCTAIRFDSHGVMALYNNENSLFAYKKRMKIYDVNNQSVLQLIDLRSYTHETSALFTNVPLKYAHPTSNYRYAEETRAKTGAKRIFQYNAKGKCTFCQLIGMLLLSTHREVSLVSLDKPSPEIEYFYFDSKPHTCSYIS